MQMMVESLLNGQFSFFFFLSFTLCFNSLDRDNQRFTYLLLGSKNIVVIFQEHVLSISFCILNFHPVYLKPLSSMQTWNIDWYDVCKACQRFHGHVAMSFKYLPFLHLQGHLEVAFSVYEEAIATERGKEQSHLLPMLFVQYSRFLYLVGWPKPRFY